MAKGIAALILGEKGEPKEVPEQSKDHKALSAAAELLRAIEAKDAHGIVFAFRALDMATSDEEEESGEG